MTRTRGGSPDRGFVRQSATSSVAALFALLSGLLLDVVLASRLGAGPGSDSLFAALRIPIGLTALLTSVASVAWVPLFVRERRENGQGSMVEFASRLLTAVLLGGGVLYGLAFALARPLIDATAPGLNAHQSSVGASVVPALFLLIPLCAAAEVVRSMMNASFSFVLPAAMNLFMNGTAAALVVAHHGQSVRFIAWAYVIGAGAQLLVITAFAWSQGCRITLGRQPADARVRQAMRLSRRPTVSSVLNLLNRVLEQALASFLPAGSITVLAYSQRLISAVGGGIFFRPITVALLPRLARAEQADDPRRVSGLLRQAVRLVLIVSLPLTIFTVALASPVVRLVFHRGSFTAHSAHLLALTLAVYGASLVGSGVQRVLLAPFYARLDTRTPLRNTAFGVVVDLVLILPCVALFGIHSANGLIGIAIAYSIAQYAIVWHAWWRLRDSVALDPRSLRGFVLRCGVASAVSLGAMLVLVSTFRLADETSRLGLALETAGIALAGAVLLGAGLFAAAWSRSAKSAQPPRHRR